MLPQESRESETVANCNKMDLLTLKMENIGKRKNDVKQLAMFG